MNRRVAILLAITLVTPAISWAQNLSLTPGSPLSLGEVVPTSTLLGGSFTIQPLDGTTTGTNAQQIGLPSRGSFDMRGRPWLEIIVTVTPSPFLCDTAYLGACAGSPTLSLTHTFTGFIGDANCRNPVQCDTTVYIGGTLDFGPSTEGRWTSDITIIANYQ